MDNFHTLKVDLRVKDFVSSVELDGKKLRGVQLINISQEVGGFPEVTIKMICDVTSVTSGEKDIEEEVDHD